MQWIFNHTGVPNSSFMPKGAKIRNWMLIEET